MSHRRTDIFKYSIHPEVTGLGFERVRQVQERNIERFMAKKGVEDITIGHNPNGQLSIMLYISHPYVTGIPKYLEDIPVEIVMTDAIDSLENNGRSKRQTKSGKSNTPGKSDINDKESQDHTTLPKNCQPKRKK